MNSVVLRNLCNQNFNNSTHLMNLMNLNILTPSFLVVKINHLTDVKRGKTLLHSVLIYKTLPPTPSMIYKSAPYVFSDKISLEPIWEIQDYNLQ
jgi:hypothetical protein